MLIIVVITGNVVVDVAVVVLNFTGGDGDVVVVEVEVDMVVNWSCVPGVVNGVITVVVPTKLFGGQIFFSDDTKSLSS